MNKPYKKILHDCRLSGDDKRRNQVKLYNDSIVKDRSNKEYVYVDNSIADAVKRLNEIGDIVTTSSCSGVFKDHYNMSMLRMQLSYSDLLESIDLTVKNLRTPVLAIEPYYHKETKRGYEVSEEFYRMKEEIGNDTYDVKNQKEFSWSLSTSLNSISEDRSKLVYTFRPSTNTFAQSLRLSESYEEMDDNISSCIDNLEEFLLERVS